MYWVGLIRNGSQGHWQVETDSLDEVARLMLGVWDDEHSDHEFPYVGKELRETGRPAVEAALKTLQETGYVILAAGVAEVEAEFVGTK
ncbi:hypothetical protein [Streptomyces sp. NRRL S-241]|uniref:hypothetical protein n=1 Tax=Streptomyces sp. NRRL S-241 TaxID=1463896 RepID=UPI0004BFEC1C|nr:hypothetical protein [Streptomyces sp. NRRL S-241]